MIFFDVKALLYGERIYLRPLEENDAYTNYCNWFNDEEVCRYNNHYRFPYLHEEALQYVNYARQAKEALILAIIDKEENNHIGNISLQEINYISRSADFAIVLGEKQNGIKDMLKRLLE